MGCRHQVCSGYMNTKLTYTEYVPEPWRQKRMQSDLFGFPDIEDSRLQTYSWSSVECFTRLTVLKIKGGSCVTCMQFFRRIQTQSFSPLIQIEEVFVNAVVVGCVWFGWASYWTRATRATSCCRRDVVPSRSHPPGEWTNVTSPPHHLGPHGHDCASSCSDVTQLQSSNSSLVFSFKERDSERVTCQRIVKEARLFKIHATLPPPFNEVYLTSENWGVSDK